MHLPYLLLLLLFGLTRPSALAQASALTDWRPFRAGFVYGFAPGATSGPGGALVALHTLRADSAYVTASGDSAYAFNRLLRNPGSNPNSFVKSRNNLFGARLRWQPGTADYYLETNAEPVVGGAATTLLLRPRLRAGATWTASTTPALTATLSSRTLGLVGTVADSLATITLSNGQQLVCGKHSGLVQGPRWLNLTGPATAATWQQPAPPQAGLGVYDPRGLFALSVGDELGYELISYTFGGSIVCASGYRLRRIIGRQLTADSLVITFSEQQQLTQGSAPGCSGTPGTTASSVRNRRWVFSLTTGRSRQFPFLALLTGEYRPGSSPASLFMGRITTPQAGQNSCRTSNQTLSFVPMYPQPQTALPQTYTGGLDDAAFTYDFSASLGLGPLDDGSSVNQKQQLTYYQRTGTTCGDRANFVTLLPTRAAARAAETATLFPNPAPADAATLALQAPARPGTTLLLLDARGRLVWSAPVIAGQAALPVPLAGQAPGLYLLRLLSPDGPSASWPLLH